VLKLYAWEPPFQRKIGEIRDREIRLLRRQAYLGSVSSLLWTFTPFMVRIAWVKVDLVSGEFSGLISSTGRAGVPGDFRPRRLPERPRPGHGLRLPEPPADHPDPPHASAVPHVRSRPGTSRFGDFSLLGDSCGFKNRGASTLQTAVSLRRIDRFMNARELNPGNVSRDPAPFPGEFRHRDDRERERRSRKRG